MNAFGNLRASAPCSARTHSLVRRYTSDLWFERVTKVSLYSFPFLLENPIQYIGFKIETWGWGQLTGVLCQGNLVWNVVCPVEFSRCCTSCTEICRLKTFFLSWWESIFLLNLPWALAVQDSWYFVSSATMSNPSCLLLHILLPLLVLIMTSYQCWEVWKEAS